VCLILLVIFVGFVYCEENKVEPKSAEKDSEGNNGDEGNEGEEEDVQMNRKYFRFLF